MSVPAAMMLAGCDSQSDGGNTDEPGTDTGSGQTDAPTDTPTPEPYPTDTIELVIGYGVGGGSDTWARAAGSAMETVLETPIEYNNIDGSATLRAQRHMNMADPDGYTVGFLSLPSNAISAQVTPPDDFDPQEAFEFVGRAGIAVYAIITNPDDDVENLSDLLGRYQSGDFETVGTTPLGQSQAIAETMRLDSEYDMSWDRVATYDSSGEVAQSVASGEVNAGIVGETTVVGLEDQLDVVSIPASSGSELFDAPTAEEEGYPNIDYISALHRTFYVPEGTPEARKQVLEDSISEAVESEELQEWAEESGQNLSFAGMEETQQLYQDSYEEISDEVIEILSE